MDVCLRDTPSQTARTVRFGPDHLEDESEV